MARISMKIVIMIQVYGLDDTVGRYKVRNMDKGCVMNYIRKGCSFSDEVLTAVGIKKSVGEARFTNEVCRHEGDGKKYERDTSSIGTILKGIRTVDGFSEYEAVPAAKDEPMLDEAWIDIENEKKK